MKKIISLITVVFFYVLSSFSSVSAQESLKIQKPLTSIEGTYLFENEADREDFKKPLTPAIGLESSNGSTYFFESEADREEFRKSQMSRVIGFSLFKNISSTRKNKLWVGYHSGTSSWAKASRYSLQKNKSFSASGSYTYGGINVDIGFSYNNSVTTTIPADSTKWSRLGMWADYTFKKQQWINNFTGQIITLVDVTRHNRYVQPKYK